MNLLVLHGPNMNLYGVRSAKAGEHVTLDKINRSIRRFIRGKDISIKIIQTHNEGKIVSYLHRNRTKFDGLIITPGVWQSVGFLLKDTLDILDLNHVIVHLEKKEKGILFSGSKAFFNPDIYKSFEEALLYYESL